MRDTTPSAEALIAAWRTTHPWPGRPYPLGATAAAEGTNFALFSERAENVDLCLFHPADPGREVIRFSVRERTDHVWHIFVPGVGPGTCYGYRVYGEWDPANGQLFNPHKVLLDPYAKAVEGEIEWDDAMYGYRRTASGGAELREQNTSKNDRFVSKSVVIDPAYDWQSDAPPDTPIHNTLIYELHVKGFTALNERIPRQLRGTYAGLAHPASVEYLLDLGVTAVELMPVHQFVQDHRLEQLGLRNYWGYNTLSFFAPHAEYAFAKTRGGQVREFKDTVRSLHAAGLEVILDVVYNHTGEGDHLGPTLNLKGIDNEAYYRLKPDDKGLYTDYTGTGNTLNMVVPRVLQLVMDSLRYWVTEMHVDGFRFDLASALARGLFEVGKLSTFLDTIHQDPIISQVKLIAEPWDVGPGGYQVGNFPVQWAEWNGKYRDSVRGYWRGDGGKVPELAYRLTGSSDLYEHNGRKPTASINFVTAHDGFTLRDLVSYNEKHNLANGEGNRDGESNNESWNCGAEGPTDDGGVNGLRARQQRNFLATLLLSQGVPMLYMGDEYGHSKLGNNNTYCQDNALNYFAWSWDDEQERLHGFVRELVALRRDNPVLHRRRFFAGRPVHDNDVTDILWLTPGGVEMTDEDWRAPGTRSLGMLLNGEAIDEYDERGVRVRDDVFLLIVNSFWDATPFVLPGEVGAVDWANVVDTDSGKVDSGALHPAGSTLLIEGRSLVMLCRSVQAGVAPNHRRWIVQLAEDRRVSEDEQLTANRQVSEFWRHPADGGD